METNTASHTNFVMANGLTLHVKRSGAEDGTPVIFVNSLGSDLRIWDAVVPALNDYQIIRYDKRGHGLSDCPDAPYSMDDHSKDLAALLDHLNLNRVVIVGISIGGMIAMHFIAANPDRVQALVLCDTLPKIGTAEMWNERINTLHTHGMAYLGDAILERWFAPGFRNDHPAAYAGYLNMLVRMPLDGYTGSCASIRDADLSDAFADIKTPTLLLCGEEDPATPTDKMKALLTLLPEAQFEQITGAGHLPCIENPDALVTSIKKFLQEVV